MCLIAIAHNVHPRYPLVVAANRDEYYARPSTTASWWKSGADILSGRDLKAGGTWLGITRSGRFAAVTNYREAGASDDTLRSRGLLVSGFLSRNISPVDYCAEILRSGTFYGGFNLVFGDGEGLFHCSNRGEKRVNRLEAGIHGVSNGAPDCDWPKVAVARERLASVMIRPEIDPEDLFLLLSDRTVWPDSKLPDTGVGIERERFLSPLFIAGSEYGTRSSTVITVDRHHRVAFRERVFDEEQRVVSEARFEYLQGGGTGGE